MGEKIIIKQDYFTNIQTAINSLNEFFTSGFTTKNFPVLNGDFELDPTVEKILSRLNAVDPAWVTDESKLHDMISTINESIQNIDPVDGVYETIISSNNETLINAVEAYIGFKELQFIADNFDAFSNFINGIYTFKVFTNPSEFNEVLDLFSSLLSFNEMPDLDIEEKIFDEEAYVDGVFKNDQIEIPESMSIEQQVERMRGRIELTGYDILVDDSVQEAAEVNYFTDAKPKHIQYNESTKKWIISKQLTDAVDKLVSSLRGCDTTDDLRKIFEDDSNHPDPNMFISNTIPFILVKVFGNEKKYPAKNYNKEEFKKYTDSYDSIVEQNNGAARFKNYDLYSTFKTDKEGTIKFIEDFLKLNLVNDEDATIINNTLLTIFNIFDSRIYLDIMYNLAPESIKQSQGEDAFVKEIRGKINKNSRTANAYTDDSSAVGDNVDDDGAPITTSSEESQTDVTNPNTTEAISEYVVNELIKFGDMSLSDMMYCEHFYSLIEKEINTLDDKLYNEGMTADLVNEYIGESFNVLDGEYIYVQEATTEVNREKLNNSIDILMDDMQEIVDLNKKKKWNYNKMQHTYTSLAGSLTGPPKNIYKRSEKYKTIKQASKYVNRAIHGSCGQLREADVSTLKELQDKLDSFIKCCRMNSFNPVNGIRDIFGSSKQTKNVTKLAELADEILNMKSSLEFIKDKPVQQYGTHKPIKEESEEKKESSDEEEVTQESTLLSLKEFQIIMEQEKGDIPEYMKNRLKMSDEILSSPAPIDLPDDIPSNAIDDLTDSINTKVNTEAETENEMLGSGYETNPNRTSNDDKHIVVNITNNYTNSFNRDSYNTNSTDDHSTGKTTNTTTNMSNSNNDSSSNKNTDSSRGKSRKTVIGARMGHPTNNNNNSGTSKNNTKESISKQDKSQTLSNGMSVQEMFVFLESKEPLLFKKKNATPTLTQSMKEEETMLSDNTANNQNKGKLKNPKDPNSFKLTKPISSTKNWLMRQVDSVIKRDENYVKKQFVENKSYRSSIYKAGRIALELGLLSVAFALNPYIGLAGVILKGLQIGDRDRLRREALSELSAELEIVKDKISKLESEASGKSDEQKQVYLKKKYEYMRMKNKLEQDILRLSNHTIKHPREVY